MAVLTAIYNFLWGDLLSIPPPGDRRAVRGFRPCVLVRHQPGHRQLHLVFL
ncbi:hypothetical protein [Candidatus Allofournierella excrementigallinarum]|uniref:hypothetical protein n=1 Tax=Candidatus Allofournierella excrementigallinarum TaxID=2838592 RepID=UPI00374F50BE